MKLLHIEPQEVVMRIPSKYMDHMLQQKMCEHVSNDLYVWTKYNCTGTYIQFV